jgi:hypothetical protein
MYTGIVDVLSDFTKALCAMAHSLHKCTSDAYQGSPRRASRRQRPATQRLIATLVLKCGDPERQHVTSKASLTCLRGI